MKLEVFLVFRQKIGDTYNFDIMSINPKMESSTVGFIVFNSKSGNTFLNTNKLLVDCGLEINHLVEDTKKAVVELEKVFSNE